MKVVLHVWRQAGPTAPGKLVDYEAADISPDMSFLEMLDVINERLIEGGQEPIAFDHDCREGICGACGMMINGAAHGPSTRTTACQLHMRSFNDGDEIWVEPWRARAFPIVKDLWSTVAHSIGSFRLAGSGRRRARGALSDVVAIPIPKQAADDAMDAAACIGCGACVAACPNASASLFTAAKITHLGELGSGGQPG